MAEVEQDAVTTAARGGVEAGLAARLVAQSLPLPGGLAGPAASDFVRSYLDHIGDPASALGEGIDEGLLVQRLHSHVQLGERRAEGQILVKVQPPTHRGGSTVVQLVSGDRPWIVDTLTLGATRRGWSIREIVHPQIVVRRDGDGRLLGAGSPSDTGARAESWVDMELYPAWGSAAGDEAPLLEQDLREAMAGLSAVTEDVDRMRLQAVRNADSVLGGHGPSEPRERALTSAMLRWLLEGHFVFLGYREYEVSEDGQEFTPREGTGLGVLRDDLHDPSDFSATPQASSPELMVCTKDSIRSTLVRGAYRDYLGIRVRDESGRLVGEHRFLGLFTSSAYAESVLDVPILRGKAGAIMDSIGYAPDSYGGQAVMAALDAYPRDELLQASAEELTPVIDAVSRLGERNRLRVFVRAGRWGRFLSALVYFPRDRYNTAVRERMQRTILDVVGGSSIDHRASVSDSVLARLYFTVQMQPGHELDAPVDSAELQRRLSADIRGWDDDFIEIADNLDSERRGIDFPDSYKDDYPAWVGVEDLLAFDSLAGDDDMVVRLFSPHEPDAGRVDARLKVFTMGEHLDLSRVMPHLSCFGVDVREERPYHVRLRGRDAMLYDFGLGLEHASEALRTGQEQARTRFTEAFKASVSGVVDPDALNRLVADTELDWRDVEVLRAVSRYLQQARSSFSQAYIATTLVANPAVATALVKIFRARFDPGLGKDLEQRRQLVDELVATVHAELEAVTALDHDRILRQFLAVLLAAVRTNHWVPGARALAIKLATQQIDFLPSPVPLYEIFVYDRRVEGVHLRFGKVARGGIRWSDRAEDYRTEILGLVKAQMVKNSVIVPVGAKGGFFPHRLHKAMTRAERGAEGVESYKIFVSSLLSVTDNIVDGTTIHPDRVVTWDEDDPYLVVAADKGTATFSDIANSLAQAQDYWLGDAFASGGSVGYDHKAMGITARGAWESVTRHFRERGLDPQTQEFSCVGIGDMSGDVFGNGMLLSHRTRLVAAFNHLHVFLDPQPDPETSWQERRRLFELPRSTWADYDPSLISEGGGVYPRSAKSIAITEPVRAALDLPAGSDALTPAELIHAILQAPVDLLWNGGIGTYVKATGETNAQVGDKANDAVRVNGSQVRATVAGEGGNLGWTQAGRVEYARAGGRINTDFIDNSAGVDTSDHEVNIKILLDAQVRTGRLTRSARDELLPTMAEDVARHVLAHNVEQNLTLENSSAGAVEHAGVHEELMCQLEAAGYLDRRLESLPSSTEMARRIERGEGLVNPELCTVLAWTKIALEDEILASDLPEDPYVAERLLGYFPPVLRERFADGMRAHPLHREIITTVVVNRFVDSQGISAASRLSEESGASDADVIRAQLAVRGIFGAGRLEQATAAAGMSSATRLGLRLSLRQVVERGTRWLLHNHLSTLRPGGEGIEATTAQYREDVRRVLGGLPQLLTAGGLAGYRKNVEQLRSQGVADELVAPAASWPRAHQALPIVRVAHGSGQDVELSARVFFILSERLHMDPVLIRVEGLSRRNRWDIMARAAIRDELQLARESICRQVLNEAVGADAEQIVDTWGQTHTGAARTAERLGQLCVGEMDLARASVALQTLRSLLS
ncbi:MAG: NAD-glutamate dehydrogenase [Propionibacterium sp.]